MAKVLYLTTAELLVLTCEYEVLEKFDTGHGAITWKVLVYG